MSVRLLQQPVFIQPIRLANKTFQPVAVYRPLKDTLTDANKHLRRGARALLALHPNDAQGINAKRGTLLPKNLVDELFAAQVFLFGKSVFFLAVS